MISGQNLFRPQIKDSKI